MGNAVIISKGWDQYYVLVNELDGELVPPGSLVRDRDGVRLARITGGRAPHKPSSTGRVWIQPEDPKAGFGNGSCEFFPSVFGLCWAPAVSEAEA